MPGRHLGYLDIGDPLYCLLAKRIFPDTFSPSFRVYQLASKQVYKYTEEKSNTSVVCKFFDPKDSSLERLNRLKGEFDNLVRIRSFGFDRPPFYVVKPITKEESIGLAVVEEYIEGRDLDYYLKKAVFQADERLLYERLSLLSFFLCEIHRRTQTDSTADQQPFINYLYWLIDYLTFRDVISRQDIHSFKHQVDKWAASSLLWGHRNVIIHGDATPTNFIFTSSSEVVAIDMERMRFGDAAYDIGMVCGELKHAFLWRTGNPYRAEPFIRHFLKEYVRDSKDPRQEFRRLTARIPFYMALTELRIARNIYLDWDYRRRIAYEARSCLQGGLRHD